MKKFKKGCFIVLLVVLTAIIAFLIYFFKYKTNEVSELLKPMIISSFKNEVKEKISNLEPNKYKDSLQAIIGEYLTKIEVRKDKDFSALKADHFFDNIRISLSDGKIDSFEIKNLRNLLIKNLGVYERSEKNRN
jgi:hypothetical protein